MLIGFSKCSIVFWVRIRGWPRLPRDLKLGCIGILQSYFNQLNCKPYIYSHIVSFILETWLPVNGILCLDPVNIWPWTERVQAAPKIMPSFELVSSLCLHHDTMCSGEMMKSVYLEYPSIHRVGMNCMWNPRLTSGFLGFRARIYILDQASGQMGEGTARYRIGVQGKAGLL